MDSLKLLSNVELLTVEEDSISTSQKSDDLPRNVVKNLKRPHRRGSSVKVDESRQHIDENGKEMEDTIDPQSLKDLTISTSYKKQGILAIRRFFQSSRDAVVDIEKMKEESLKALKWKNNKIKAVKLTGEVMLAGAKIQKMLGSPMTPSQIKLQKEFDDREKFSRINEAELAKMKKIYTAPDAGVVNAKAMKVMGEKMLGAEKALKLLGNDSEADDFARKVSDEQLHVDISMDMQRKFSAPDPGSLNPKAIKVMGGL